MLSEAVRPDLSGDETLKHQLLDFVRRGEQLQVYLAERTTRGIEEGLPNTNAPDRSIAARRFVCPFDADWKLESYKDDPTVYINEFMSLIKGFEKSSDELFKDCYQLVFAAIFCVSCVIGEISKGEVWLRSILWNIKDLQLRITFRAASVGR